MGRPKKKPGDDFAFLVPPPRKKHVFGKAQRKRLVKTGKELCILNKDDIAYIMDLSHTESQVRTRYTTARLRAR